MTTGNKEKADKTGLMVPWVVSSVWNDIGLSAPQQKLGQTDRTELSHSLRIFEPARRILKETSLYIADPET